MVRGIGDLPPSGIPPRGTEGFPRPIDGGRGRDGAPPLVHGALVEGTVVALEGEEAYRIQVAGRFLTARSTVPLSVGQRFRAVWDASGDIPMLRLQESDQALLGRISPQDRDLAEALLSRGLPLSKDVLSSLRGAWLRLGGGSERLGPMVELWARHLPLTEENLRILAWYATLDNSEVRRHWRRIRDQLKDPATPREGYLRGRLEDDELRRFATATGLLATPAREGVDPSLLTPVRWPLDDEEPLPAKVSAQVEETKHGKVYRVAFEVEGEALGVVGGEVTSDGVQLAVNLRPEDPMMASLLRRRLPELERDLADGALRLVRAGVTKPRPGGTPTRLRRVDLEA
ncbi:MAG TPA: hypothetical protein PK393_03910 [Synergistaceae bacterium]|nr:hypothetical protein [Synergistaceae bacterium]HQH78065.1 hypothetical protein [Synergistaceae bacterium]HQK24649.1 hypothetical protein [Synergistaceae bacterium]